MLDGIDAGLDRLAPGLVAMAMDRNFLAQPMSLVDQRRHFRGRELRRVHFVREREHAARDRRLDHVRAIFHFEPDGFPNRVGPIGDSFTEVRFVAEKHVAKSGGAIKMPTRRADPVSGHQHPRTRHDPVID